MIDLDNEQDDIFRSFLRLTLDGVDDDVSELLTHLGADFSEIMKLSINYGNFEDVGFSTDVHSELTARERTLHALGVASRLSEKMLADLADGIKSELIVVGALCCESLIKKAAGWCFGVELTGVKVTAKRLSERNAGNASMPRPNGRVVDHEDVLMAYRHLVREGHTEREARGILVQRGNMGSQATIYRVTNKK
jgi:hypothetical protein